MKKLILYFIAIIEGIANRVVLKRKRVKYSPTLRINGIVKVFGHGKISIGENVRINSKESANPGIGGCTKTVLSVPTGELIIGDNVGMSNVAVTCCNKVEICNNVLIGGNVKIYDTDFHSLDPDLRGKGRNIDVPVTKPICIKENAFIGAHSIILKGVTIGRNAVIGAGSVVTKDVPDGEVWGGNPAKKIR